MTSEPCTCSGASCVIEELENYTVIHFFGDISKALPECKHLGKGRERE